MEGEIDMESFLAVKLSQEKPKYEWNPEKLDQAIQHSGDKFSKPKHTLVLKRAIIDGEAKDGELNLIEIETKDVEGEDVKVPLAFLQAGSILQTSLNIPITDTTVKFTLAKGTGPVHIIATHTITAPTMDDGEDEDVEDEELIENGESEDEVEIKEVTTNGKDKETDKVVPVPMNDRKRKIDADEDSNIKKIKTAGENGTDSPSENQPESIEMESSEAK